MLEATAPTQSFPRRLAPLRCKAGVAQKCLVGVPQALLDRNVDSTSCRPHSMRISTESEQLGDHGKVWGRLIQIRCCPIFCHALHEVAKHRHCFLRSTFPTLAGPVIFTGRITSSLDGQINTVLVRFRRPLHVGQACESEVQQSLLFLVAHCQHFLIAAGLQQNRESFRVAGESQHNQVVVLHLCTLLQQEGGGLLASSERSPSQGRPPKWIAHLQRSLRLQQYLASRR
mmetsp:Transcript_36253/g.74477  ORF Transcript_36253/g.74477 Transcript_36253/m.74477 type:complete len:229 (+) Transcript_36253:205-891(+)